jgi:ferredoxin
MAYKINPKSCLKCGICIKKCPEGAIVSGTPIKESDGLLLYPTKIAAKKCTDCGVCVSEEYWCPAQAISQA